MMKIVVAFVLILLALYVRWHWRKRAEVHVAIIATDADRAKPLLASLKKKKGYCVHLMGVGEVWTGFDAKLRKTLQLAKRLRPNDILMHLDAYDTYVLSDASEVADKFRKANAGIVLSTEVNLYPNDLHTIKPVMDGIYPTAPTRFRWINSGTYIGYAGAIVSFLSSMPPDFHCDQPNGERSESCDDQRCFHTYYLREHQKHNIKLDTEQEIFPLHVGCEKILDEPHDAHPSAHGDRVDALCSPRERPRVIVQGNRPAISRLNYIYFLLSREKKTRSMSVVTTPTFYLATLTLTDSQVRGLLFTPQTLVAAPGANKVIIPIAFTCDLKYVASFGGGGKKITIQMTSSNPLWQTAILDTAQATNLFASGGLGWVGNYKPTTNYANKSITVTAGASYTGGTGSQLVLTCLYHVVDV